MNRIMGIAAASNRIAFVCLHDGNLIGWGIFGQHSNWKENLVGSVQSILTWLRPRVVVTEDCDAGCRKGRRTRTLIASLAALASHNTVHYIANARPRNHRSKYEEVIELLSFYPELGSYAPRRKRRTGGCKNNSMITFLLLLWLMRSTCGNRLANCLRVTTFSAQWRAHPLQVLCTPHDS